VAKTKEQGLDQVRDRYSRAGNILRQYCVNQDDLIDTCLLATLCREHVVFIGPPGSNKTRLIDIMFHLMGLATLSNRHADTNGKHRAFFTTLDKYATPEALIGPYDPRELKHGRWVRNLDGTLATAPFAFIGEIFSANNATLRSIVRVLNEREIENGGQRLKIPLQSLFCDSNHYPNESAQAVYDRLLFRCHVEYIDPRDENAFFRMLDVREFDSSKISPLLNLDSIRLGQLGAVDVDLPEEIRKELFTLRTSLLSNEIRASDRRWYCCQGALKAAAFLRGSSQVDYEDFWPLRHVLWSDPEERKVLETIVSQYTSKFREGSEDTVMSDLQKIFEEATRTEPADVGSTMEVAEKTDKISRALVAFSDANVVGEENIRVYNSMVETLEREIGLSTTTVDAFKENGGFDPNGP